MRNIKFLDFLPQSPYLKIAMAAGAGGYMLYEFYNRCCLSLQQHIQKERDNIAYEGKSLGNLKDKAITQNRKLPHDYAIRLLKLMAKIARHDITYRNQYGNERARKRRSNLGNLAITAKLFRDPAGQIPYHPELKYKETRLQGYVGTNFFNDLAFLYLFNITRYDNPLSRPLYDMSDNEVSTILDDICGHIETIANAEIEAYQKQWFSLGQPLHNLGVIKNKLRAFCINSYNLERIRNQYRDHRRLNQLYILTSYHKEHTHINSAIEAINRCRNINFTTGPTLLAKKRAMLRYLTIIGEAFTQSNLTPQTRSLSGLAQRDYQLFKKIRDGLAHSEKDIHAKRVETYIRNHNIANLRPRLPFLRQQLYLMGQRLLFRKQNNQLAAHYNDANLAPPAEHKPPGAINHVERFQNIRNFSTAIAIRDNIYRRHKRDYPAEFTPLAMARMINNEIDEIRSLIANIPHRAALDDPYGENKHQILNQGSPNFLQRIQQANHNDHDLTQAINTIRTRGFKTQNGILIIEMPNNIFVPPFNPNQYNFNNIANALKQYSRKLLFIRDLTQRPATSQTLEYHIGRIVKFLNVIPKKQLINLLQGMREPEIRTFRNLIQHDSNETDLTGIPIEAFIFQYVALITRTLPQLLQPLYQHGPQPVPRRRANFASKKSLIRLGLFGGAVAVGASYYFREDLGTNFLSTLKMK